MQRQLPGAPSALNAEISATPSKSVTHRALVAAALANGVSTVENPLRADDTEVTAAGLRVLGCGCERRDGAWLVHGRGRDVRGGGSIELRDSGTSLRLLTAVAAFAAQPCTLDGSARLRERPIRPLVDALRELGAALRLEATDRLPLVAGGRAPDGDRAGIEGSRSSQFASALMMVGPLLPRGLRIDLEPPVRSEPYLELTAQVMRAFGAEVRRSGKLRIDVSPAGYRATRFRVDGDHSSASYLLAAPLIAGGRVRVRGLDPGSFQADAALGRLLERLGADVRRGTDWIEVRSAGAIPSFDVSLADAPDLVPTVAALAAFADGTAVIRDVPHLRLKESDRLQVLADNFRALGRPVETTGDGLRFEGGAASWRQGLVRTAGDHRIAMAFALVGLRVPGLAVDDGACVAKSNPAFWENWEELLR